MRPNKLKLNPNKTEMFLEGDWNLPADMYQRKPKQQPSQEKIGSLDFPQKFKNQDFVHLRDYCLNHGILFEDDTFPAHFSSIGPKVLTEDNLHRIQWLRPTEIMRDPCLFVDGVSRADILQGQIGDCWVLAALGSLTRQERFLNNVIPKDQGFKYNYAGIFHFRFWHFGDWVDVVIDDQLLFHNGNYLFVHPRSKNEFWPPLLEKAYAKLRGSYTNLDQGYLSEALVDFTGGVQVPFSLKNPPACLFDMLQTAVESGCLMGCTTPEGKFSRNMISENGIVQLHAYTVVCAAEVPYMNRKESLVRLWNPYGDTEWKGAWSDRSVEWDQVPIAYKKKLYEAKDDGEFWISYKDFKENFSFLIVCNNVPTFLDCGEQGNTTWSVDIHSNRFTGPSLGRSAYYEDALSRHPQYFIQVPESKMKNYNLVVALSQDPENDTGKVHIGFVIVKVGPEGKTTLHNSGLLPQRDVVNCFHLSPGTYIIIPTASQEGQGSEFLLRTFLKSWNNFRFSPTLREANTELPPVVTKVNISPQSVLVSSQSEPLIIQDIPKWNQDNYKTIFLRYANQSSSLDASQLQRILNQVVLKDLMASPGSRDGFSFDSSKSLLALMDINANGSLSLVEFEKLWRDLNKYKDIFRMEDEQNSGFLNVSNLKRVIQERGLSISDKLLRLMTVRYGDSTMRINLPDFVCCMIRLETMAKAFHNLSTDGRGIYFTEEQWVTMVMYC
ncbi:calpain-13 [Sceloporus undulatus]|uniref:calpain-13 n=1 Tax=Sceloporus undulatus TaxID=8520 RepID=UPI001C4CA7B8|nr:calpain-13 [Sceloporus undulatus]